MVKRGYKSGYCPFCDARLIEYGAIELDDNCLYYPFTCDECGAEGKEWYDIEYTESEAWKEEK